MDFQELFQNDNAEEEDIPDYTIIEWNGFRIRLLNVHHSLWGDKLAECSKLTAQIIINKEFNFDVTGKTVIEFGAGAGLPSIVAGKCGAKNVIATDYNDDILIDNLKFNVSQYSNVQPSLFQ